MELITRINWSGPGIRNTANPTTDREYDLKPHSQLTSHAATVSHQILASSKKQTNPIFSMTQSQQSHEPHQAQQC